MVVVEGGTDDGIDVTLKVNRELMGLGNPAGGR